MSEKFTPGPWKISAIKPGDKDIFISANEGEYEQLDCTVSRDDCDQDVALANAKLIAAAPELYQALKNLIFTSEKLWDQVKPVKDSGAMKVTHPMIEQAKSVIEKASV